MSSLFQGRKSVLNENIREIICDLSGLEDSDLSSQVSFLDLGFDSLFMTQLSGAFQKRFSIKITFRQLLNDLASTEKLIVYLDENLAPDQFLAQVEAPTELSPPVVDLRPTVAESNTATLNSSLATLAQIAGPGNTGQTGSAVSAIFAEQLKLMSLQLSVLQNKTGALTTHVGATSLTNQPAPTVTSVITDSDLETSVKAKASATEVNTAEEEKPEIKLPAGFGPQIDEDADDQQLSEQQQHHLQQLIAEYNEQTQGSKQLAQQYRKVHADPRTAAGFNAIWKEMVYPIVVERSKGSRLWDVDGNEYIDLLNGFGPNFLGHSPDYITEALHQQLDKGIEIGPQTPLAGEVARLICEMTNCDRVTFVNTGSEAVQAVIRVARTITGKEKIVVFNKDYHGNFDEVLVRGVNRNNKLRTMPIAPGVPYSAVENILVLDYGDEKSLEIIAQHADDIAAVMIEPMQSRRPEFQPKSFVKKLREITEQKDIVLVFDEVITGFRTGLGGAQEFYGVQADLVTYGKVLGGGMPFGVVAGKALYMDTFDGGEWQYGDDSFPGAGVTFFAGTFVRHPLAIAAAHATLTFLKDAGQEIYTDIYQKTSRLANALNRLFENNLIDIHVAHFSSQMYFRIGDDSELLPLLFYHARKRGVFMLEGFPSYLTLAHTDEDIDKVIEVFAQSVYALQEGGILPLPESREVVQFALSASQMDVWFASKLNQTASCAYNESDTLQLSGSLDTDVLVAAIKQVLQRHSGLNLRFDAEGQYQYVDWSIKHKIPVLDFSALSNDDMLMALERFYEGQATGPFNLEQGPLIRAHIIQLTQETHLLVVYAHHLVFDGWSASIVFNEIAQIYHSQVNGVDLVLPQCLGYKQYVDELQLESSKPEALADLAYWQKLYQDSIPVHNLPTDYPRPDKKKFNGATLHYEFDETLHAGVRSVAKSQGVTLHTVLLTAFSILLHRLSGDEQWVLGVPTAGQLNGSNDCLVGYCVNLLPMRQEVQSEASISELLQESKERILDAFEHQHCDFSTLLKSMELPRDLGRSPLVDVVFNFSSYFEKLEFGGLEASVFENARRAVNFDLFLNIVEIENMLHVDWDYSTDLFTDNTILCWLGNFECILKAMINNPDQKIGNVAFMNTDEEKSFLEQ